MTKSNVPTVLIIDDSPAIIEGLRTVLRPHYRVLAARTGEAGIRIAKSQNRPNLILLDVVMPGLGGYAVIAALRESPQTSAIPVVLLTSLADTADEERGFEFGAADYISKPIKPAVLVARVRTQLQLAARAAELAASETRLRAVIDSAIDAVLTFDRAGKLQSINAAGVTMFGYGPAEILERPIGSLMPDIAGADPGDMIRDFFRSDESIVVSERSEVQGRRKDGSRFPMELGLSKSKCDGADFFIVYARDLTSQRNAEANVERLRQERLTAIGGMAVTLAHEINQPFLASIAYLNTARQLLATPIERRCTTVEESLDLAADQLLRAGQIIGHLREFVSSGEPNKTFQKLHELIREAHSFMIKPLEAADVETTLQLDAGIDLVLADKFQIRQVLINLVRNASEAMNASYKRELKIVTSLIGDEMFRIDIIDTGRGIPPEVKTRLFEPFFTSKENGMGVGLAISRVIVEAHYGTIWVDKNPSGGAIVSFTLPIVIRGA